MYRVKHECILHWLALIYQSHYLYNTNICCFIFVRKKISQVKLKVMRGDSPKFHKSNCRNLTISHSAELSKQPAPPLPFHIKLKAWKLTLRPSGKCVCIWREPNPEWMWRATSVSSPCQYSCIEPYYSYPGSQVHLGILTAYTGFTQSGCDEPECSHSSYLFLFNFSP